MNEQKQKVLVHFCKSNWEKLTKINRFSIKNNNKPTTTKQNKRTSKWFVEGFLATNHESALGWKMKHTGMTF